MLDEAHGHVEVEVAYDDGWRWVCPECGGAATRQNAWSPRAVLLRARHALTNSTSDPHAVGNVA